MSLYVLDTDTFSLSERGDPRVTARVRAVAQDELAITVITVEEQLTGWYTFLRRARQPDQVALAYERLARAVQLLGALPILVFTEDAIARYDQLNALRLNIGKMDLRIAAIVLENAATLVTRNVRDFQRVPGLVIEDWAV
jgi:tRNA(fMet)-specific endonuclease VapC